MKTNALRLLSLLLVLSPLTAMAQTNIKAAFDAIIKCSDADVSVSHSFEKDSGTGVLKGQDDVYEFVLPANKMSLIRKALAAFDKDIPQAYAVKSGKNTGSSPLIYLHSEQSGSFGIDIDNPGYNYMYALFLPSKSEDPDGKYRYAYAMNYKESKGEIRGKLVINYATSLMYRQRGQQDNTFYWKNGNSSTITTNSNGVIVIQSSDSDSGSGQRTFIQTSDVESGQQTWFEQVMACINGMAKASDKTRIALATKAYTLISSLKQYPEVTDQDKTAIRQIIKTMRIDKRYSDPILRELLRQCETAIK